MPLGGLVGLYGPPGVGKSFIAIDMACSVAAGGFWQGRKVKEGYVLYVSAEGGSGIGKRVKAWSISRGVEARDIRVAWLTESVPVNADSEGMDTLLERIEEADERPSLVIIDTLARCFDGDENQQEDMGRFVAGVDRLRRGFDATVIVVHHTRLDGDRERGNTAFRGAADTMLSVERRHGKLMLVCNKQKDAEDFDPIELKLKSVPECESCVLEVGRTHTKAHKASAILAILAEYGTLSYDEWLRSTNLAGIPKTTFLRHLVGLKKTGEIIKENGVYRLAEPV